MTNFWPHPLLATLAAGTALLGNNNSAQASGKVAEQSANGKIARAEAQHKPTIVSLAPSNTELLCTVGAGSQIIGVCSFCDYPQDTRQITQVGTFVSANLERLARLKPDLVLLVSGQEQLAAKIQHHKFNTVLIDNTHLSDISKNIKQLGQLTGHNESSAQAAQKFDLSLSSLATIIDKNKDKPKVFYCVWPQPLMTVGKNSFLNEIITACGGTNVAGEINVSYPRFSLEKLVLSNPDVIILPFEARNQSFIKTPPWSRLKAVRENRVYYLPDQKNDMLSRPTMRVIKGIAWLAGICHPNNKVELEKWSQQLAGVSLHNANVKN